MKDIAYKSGGTIYDKDVNLRIEIRNEDTGKIIYSHKSHAGVLCTVENYKISDKEKGEIDGIQQHFIWGNAAVCLHAHLQLTKIMGRLSQNRLFRKLCRKFFE